MRKSKFGAKTTFILSRPTTEPAGEIVAAGAALGLHFHPIYVHTVRLRARKLALRGPRQRGPSKSAPREVVPKGVSSTVHPEGQRKKAHHAQFVSLALEIGFVRAAELLEKVRAHVSAWSQKVKS